jgi:hypothetical protein
MALAFGGGVRPELGRTDYSAIARGGEIAAQLSAQGSQMMGQGLAKALEGAGKAIAGYQERKETNKIFDGTVDDLIKADTDSGGALAKQLKIGDPTDRKAWSVGLQSLAPDKRTSALLGRQLLQQYSQQQQMAEAFAPVVTTGPSAFETAVMSGVKFGNLPTGLGSGSPTINARPRTREEITQQLLASGAGAGPTAALINALAVAEQAGQPKPRAINLGKYTEIRNNEPVEVTIDQNSGKEIAVAPVREQPQPFENSYSRGVGEQVAEEEKSIIDLANKSVAQVAKLDQILANLETGDPTTGLFAEIRNNINRFSSQFLADEKAGKKVTDTQLLNSLLGSDVFPLIGELGIGARGIDTPAERDFLRDVFTGRIELNRDTLVKLTEMRRARAAEAVGDYNSAVERGRFKRRESFMGEPMKKIPVPERAKTDKTDLGGGFRLLN